MTHDFQGDLDDVAAIEVVPQILDVLHKTTGMGFSAVARVTLDRWIACAVNDQIGFGLTPGGELKVETTICHEIRQSREYVAIENVTKNPSWACHHTPLQYGFQSYISVPIVLEDGSFFGTLCAIDPKPADVENDRVAGMVKLFADLVAKHLDARRRLRAVEQELGQERETSQLRDQFIAVLAHDIKNPVASIAAGARMLRRSVDEKGRDVLTLMERSVARVSNIVDNVLDFARGLNGTLASNVTDGRLDQTLEEIIAEFENLHAGRVIERVFSVSDPVAVDHARIAQLFANLLSNALTHGSRDGYIRVGIEREDSVVRIWVANQGERIPQEVTGSCSNRSKDTRRDLKVSASASISPPRSRRPTAGRSMFARTRSRRGSRSRSHWRAWSRPTGRGRCRCRNVRSEFPPQLHRRCGTVGSDCLF